MMTGIPLRLSRHIAVFILCLLAGSALAQSAAYREGVRAYQGQRYPEAIQAFQRGIRDNPGDAAAYFGLGRTYYKLGNVTEAARAWEKAQQLDPSLSFTPKKDTFRQMYREAVQRSRQEQGASPGSNTLPSRTTSAVQNWENRVVQDLKSTDAYVDSSVAQAANEQRLEQVAQHHRPDVLKVAVIQAVPPGGDRDTQNDRQEFTRNLHDYLNLRDGLLVVVVPRGQNAGVSAYTGALDWGRLRPIIQESRSTFNTRPVDQGVELIADRTFGTIHARQRSSGGFWLFVLLAVVVAVVFFRSRAKAARKKRIADLNRTLNERLAALQDEFKRFDLEAASVKDTPLLQEAKQLRSAAVDPFAEAGEKFNVASTVEQYEEADRVTTQAEKLAAKARIRLEQAEGKRALDDPAEHGSIPRAEDVPADDRGACFFCSKPSRLRDLHPLDINADGQDRRVLACDDCYDIAKTGRQPQILGVPDDQGRRVPWYQSNRYDPWNDYGRGGVFGGGGMFGGGGFGLMDYLLLENLFDHDRRSNPVVITPQDPGYSAPGDSTGNFDFSGGPGSGAEGGVGDFMGSLFGSGTGGGSDSDGGFFGGGDAGDLFGNDSGGGDDFFGSDN